MHYFLLMRKNYIFEIQPIYIRPIFGLNSQCYFYSTERVVGIDFKTTYRSKTVKYAQYILCTLYTAEPLIYDISVSVSLG